MVELSEITILYVEDDPGNRTLMRAIADTENGWQLLMAETGEAGIGLAREHVPDIILMDINLPGMSGCEACAVLKRDSLTARIPILAVTANRIPCPDAGGSNRRFDAIILKPFTWAELINPIYHALSRAK